MCESQCLICAAWGWTRRLNSCSSVFDVTSASADPRLLFLFFLRLEAAREKDISLMSLSPPGEEGRSAIPKEQPLVRFISRHRCGVWTQSPS